VQRAESFCVSSLADLRVWERKRRFTREESHILCPRVRLVAIRITLPAGRSAAEMVSPIHGVRYPHQGGSEHRCGSCALRNAGSGYVNIGVRLVFVWRDVLLPRNLYRRQAKRRHIAVRACQLNSLRSLASPRLAVGIISSRRGVGSEAFRSLRCRSNRRRTIWN